MNIKLVNYLIRQQENTRASYCMKCNAKIPINAGYKSREKKNYREGYLCMSCIEELVNKAGILVKDYNEVREIQYRSKLDKRPILTTDGALGLFFETEPENMPRTLGDIQPYLDEIEMSNDQIIIERVIPQQRAPYWEVSIKRNQSNIACAASIEKQTAIFAAYKKWARVGAEHGNYNI